MFLSWEPLDTRPSIVPVPTQVLTPPHLNIKKTFQTHMSSPSSTARFNILVGSRVTLPSNKWALMLLKATRPQDNPQLPVAPVFSPTADNGRLSLPTPGSLVLKGKAILRLSIPPLPKGHSVLPGSPRHGSLAI